MKPSNYPMKTATDSSSKFCIERERLREREREARAQMTFEADQRVSQDITNSGPLFGEIVRVNPKSNDKERQQIERNLGKFEVVKHLLADQDVTNLFGVDGQPPPSPAPSLPASANSHEFKKPNACLQTHQSKSSSHHHHHHHHHSSSSSQRSGLMKPVDSKAAYGNRNLYAVQSAKHASNNANANDCRANGATSVKNLASVNATTVSSTGSGSSSTHHSNLPSSKSAHHEYSSKIPQSARNLPKINCELREPLHSLNSSDNSSVSLTNVENILDEMTSGVRTPLTAIAATPRKEMESKFTFNPVSGKMESLLPLARSSTDKNSKINPLNSILGPPGSRTFFSPLPPFSSPSSSVGLNSTKTSKSAAHVMSSVETNGDGNVKNNSATEKMGSSTLPCLRSDLSLSEDTDDGGEDDNDEDENDGDEDEEEDDDDDDDDDDDEEEDEEVETRVNNDKNDKDNNKNKSVTVNPYVSKKESSSPKIEKSRRCDGTPKEVRNTSSSDDTDTDSGSESEDSSSDSPSPPSLPLPVVTEQEGSKQRWNLRNFLPPSAHENATPTGRNSQAYQNSEKSKTDDSDSSADSVRKCSSSDSDDDGDSLKSCTETPRKTSRAPAFVSENSHGVDNGARRKYRSRTHSYSQSSEEDSRRSAFVTANCSKNTTNTGSCAAAAAKGNQHTFGASGAIVNRSPASACTNMVITSPSHSMVNTNNYGIGGNNAGSGMSSGNTSSNNGSGITSTGNAASNNAANGGGSNLTVVGVVRPHQRKPPSPQIFHRSVRSRTSSSSMHSLSPSSAATAATNDDCYAFVQQQRSLHLSSAPEPQCDLSAGRPENENVLNNVSRSMLGDHYQQQRLPNKVGRLKSTDKSTNQASKVAGKAGRKPKSPALASSNDSPVKKKRGRKRTIKVPDQTDSEDDGLKTKTPEKKKPGRPPLKRNDSEDVDWNIGSRRKFQSTNVWCDRERRRSSLRMSSFTTIDSDSEAEVLTATVKPTARVIPAVKKKDGFRVSRDSSCESVRNDSDYNTLSENVKNGVVSISGGGVGGNGGGGGGGGIAKAEESPPKLDVEGIAVQDKKKSDTLRKLFSRREEGGGKGKGGKGKCGVIVMESEVERKLLERSASAAPSPLQQGIDDRIGNRFAEMPPVMSIGDSCDVINTSTSTASRLIDSIVEMKPLIPASASARADSIPKLTYNEAGRPSLMCKIDLSKIPYILAKKRSEEVRIKCELSDTRQTMVDDVAAIVPSALDIVNVPLIEPLHGGDADRTTPPPSLSLSSSDHIDLDRKQRLSKKHSTKKSKSTKRKRYVPDDHDLDQRDTIVDVPLYAPAVHTPSVDTDIDDSVSTDSDTRKTSSMSLCSSNKKRMPVTQSDSLHNLITTCYSINMNGMPPQNVCAAGVEQTSAEDSWKSSENSCSSCSASSTPCHNDKYNNNVAGKRASRHRTSNKRKKKLRNEHGQRHSSLADCSSNLIHLPNTNHERSLTDASLNGYHQVAISDLVRPSVPTHHGIYYSYLEHKASEEINSESDNVSPNLYLMEAKRLKHAADTEKDLVAQGMQYLEAILSFVLTGHVLERKSQMVTAFNMYSETLKLIVYISKKFRTLCTNVTPTNIPNKIAILSLRCESILNLKLYMMREADVKDVHNAVAEYFNKAVAGETCLITNPGIPSPHSPTPSPASSIGSNSSGYSSGDRRSAGVSQCIAVPINLHTALQKQHNFYSNLIASFSYWEEADKLIFSGGNKDFFIELDRFCGPLTLHSSLKDLVHYVRVGIQRLKAIISHNQGVRTHS